MKWVVCSVFDNAVNCYSRPFCVRAAGEAVRNFEDECGRDPRDGQNDLFKHPSHFTLYQLGYFDDASGRFDQEVGNFELCRGEDVKVK